MPPLLHWTLRALLVGAASFALLFSRETYRGEEGWPRREALRAEVASVEHDIDVLEAQVQALQRQIVAERERPEVQEALVRDFLGYVRPNDVVLRGPETN